MKYVLMLFLSAVLIISCASSVKDAKENTTTVASTTASSDEQKIDVPAGEDSLIMVFNIKNQPAGTAKLVGMFEDQRFIVDSAKIDANGHFELSRRKLLPQGYYYFIMPGRKNSVQLLIDKDQRFELDGDIHDLANTAQVKGSTCMQLFYENMKFQSELDQKIRAVSPQLKGGPQSPQFKAAKAKYDKLVDQIENKVKEYQQKYPNNFFTKFKVAGQNPKLSYPLKANGTLDTAKQVYDYRSQFWDGYDFSEHDLLRTPVFVNKIKRYFTELVPLNQDSIIKYTDILVTKAGDNEPYFRAITNWVALKFEPGHTNLMDGEAVYSHIINKYFTDELATWSTHEELEKLRTRAKEMMPSLLGKTAQNVTAKDKNGHFQTLLDSKSPLLVVFIYSPDCEHCQEQTPKLINIYNQWHNKGVDVYSIAANTTEKEWKQFGHRFNMPWRDVFDATNASWYPKYFVDLTPEVYLLDQNRKIVAKNIKVTQLPILFKRYLR